MQNLNSIRGIPQACNIASVLLQIESDCRRKIRETKVESTQLCFGLVAISCQRKRFEHEGQCSLCARAEAA
jgi:hypothetical protein